MGTKNSIPMNNNSQNFKINKINKNTFLKKDNNKYLNVLKLYAKQLSDDSTKLSLLKTNTINNNYYSSNFFKLLNKNIRFKILFYLIDDIKNLMWVSKIWRSEILLLLKLQTSIINNKIKTFCENNNMKLKNSYFVIIHTKFGIRIDKLIKIKIDKKLINHNIKFSYNYKLKENIKKIFNNKKKYFCNFEFNFWDKDKYSRQILFIEHLKNENNDLNFSIENPEIVYSNDYILFPITLYSKIGFLKYKSIDFQSFKVKKLNFSLKNLFFNEPFFIKEKIDKTLWTMSWNYSNNDIRNRLIPLSKLKLNFDLKEICSLGNDIIVVKALFKTKNIGKLVLSNKSIYNNEINIRIIEKEESYEHVIKNIDKTNDIYDVLNLKLGDELLIVVKKLLN